jgi:hypothetical protein
MDLSQTHSGSGIDLALAIDVKVLKFSNYTISLSPGTKKIIASDGSKSVSHQRQHLESSSVSEPIDTQARWLQQQTPVNVWKANIVFRFTYSNGRKIGKLSYAYLESMNSLSTNSCLYTIVEDFEFRPTEPLVIDIQLRVGGSAKIDLGLLCHFMTASIEGHIDSQYEKKLNTHYKMCLDFLGYNLPVIDESSNRPYQINWESWNQQRQLNEAQYQRQTQLRHEQQFLKEMGLLNLIMTDDKAFEKYNKQLNLLKLKKIESSYRMKKHQLQQLRECDVSLDIVPKNLSRDLTPPSSDYDSDSSSEEDLNDYDDKYRREMDEAYEEFMNSF